jgi:hypothetical protein
MTRLKLLAAAVILSGLAPGVAEARWHHRYYHHYRYMLPYEISYLHNYGPGLEPGKFAYYDGPSTVACRQGAAAYIGQDRQRHPCF